MILILHYPLFISCDKFDITNSSDFLRAQHGVITTVVTTVLKPFYSHHENGKQTDRPSIRTKTCTYKQTMIAAVANGDGLIPSMEHKETQKHNCVVNIFRQLQTKHGNSFPHRLHSANTTHSDTLNNDRNSNLASTATRHKDQSKNIIVIMVHFSRINDNPWWKEQERCKDHDGGELSPQMIKTTMDLAMSKNNDIPSNHREGFDLVPKPDKNLVPEEGREEKEEKNFFLFDGMDLFQEEMKMVHALREAETKKLVSGEDTKLTAEDNTNPGDYTNIVRHFDGSKIETVDSEEINADGDDFSTIASSSSPAYFELFEDVSILTNEDSIDDFDDGDDDCDGDLRFNLDNPEDISLSSEGAVHSEGKDFYIIVYSLTQIKLGRGAEEHDNTKHYVVEEDNKVSDALNDNILLDFLVGICCDDGFSPEDELRLA
mmetsp:Transcript_29798/g.63801  ORF Transcript_29798/g.63801 Transcript_29798/m.63801 type:complete len:431 (+) Transcript_29798:250-1542(+)